MTKSAANIVVVALCFLFSAYSYADSLQFSEPTYTVDENGFTASITVTRDSNIDTVGVLYASSDDTA
ncbi:MAG: hypothetical protein WBP02_01230, partial [Gammaproteobacteria bacterium]